MTAYSYSQSQKRFDARVNELLAALFRQRVHRIIPSENTQTLYHGRGWSTVDADGSVQHSELSELATEATVSFDDFLHFRVEALPNFLTTVSEDIFGAAMRNFYASIGAAAEAAGNTVTAQPNAPAAAYLELLRKVDFGVEADGSVSAPQLHMHPDAVPPFLKDMEAQPPAFHAEIKRLQLEKSLAALATERERRSRYKKERER